MARPKAIIDWDKAGEMIAAGCDGVQVAAFFGIHPNTLYRTCEKEQKVSFCEYLQTKRASGDAALLKAQFDLALKDKNPTMLVWLGKQRLGQREKQDTDITSGGAKLTDIKIHWPNEG